MQVLFQMWVNEALAFYTFFIKKKKKGMKEPSDILSQNISNILYFLYLCIQSL